MNRKVIITDMLNAFIATLKALKSQQISVIRLMTNGGNGHWMNGILEFNQPDKNQKENDMEINDDYMVKVTEFSGPISVATDAAYQPVMTINIEGEECGRFYIEDGKIKFKGDFGKSALVFFTSHVQPLVDAYVGAYLRKVSK